MDAPPTARLEPIPSKPSKSDLVGGEPSRSDQLNASCFSWEQPSHCHAKPPTPIPPASQKPARVWGAWEARWVEARNEMAMTEGRSRCARTNRLPTAG